MYIWTQTLWVNKKYVKYLMKMRIFSNEWLLFSIMNDFGSLQHFCRQTFDEFFKIHKTSLYVRLQYFIFYTVLYILHCIFRGSMFEPFPFAVKDTVEQTAWGNNDVFFHDGLQIRTLESPQNQPQLPSLMPALCCPLALVSFLFS